MMMDTRDLQRRDQLRRWLSYPGVTQEKVAAVAGCPRREYVSFQAGGQRPVEDRILRAAEIVARRASAARMAPVTMDLAGREVGQDELPV